MASGLSRRRVGAGATNEESTSSTLPQPVLPSNSDRPASPRLDGGATSNSGGGSRLYQAGGHKVGFDPRDLEEQDEERLVPKLTLMEEVLLLGLKDKQVRSHARCICTRLERARCCYPGLSVILERQHFLHPQRLHIDRTGIAATDSHGQRPESKAFPSGR
jgi:hypothetical protein